MTTSGWEYEILDVSSPEGLVLVSVQSPNGGLGVVALSPEGGRLQISTVCLGAPAGLMGQLLQRLPVVKIEAWAYRQTVLQAVDGLSPAALALDRHELQLEVPPKRPYGSEFYRSVASAYLKACVVTRRPAQLIAEVNGRPVTSVHSWVKSARRYGHLPAKGIVGRAG